MPMSAHFFVFDFPQADEARQKLASALEAKKVSHERVLNDSKRYLPFIHQILLSCKVQPEVARLDGTLGVGAVLLCTPNAIIGF